MAGSDAVERREIARALKEQTRQREVDLRWEAHAESHVLHADVHQQEHVQQAEAIRTNERALASAFGAHQREHEAQAEAVKVALNEVAKLADLHATAHEREHEAHEVRHEDGRIAVTKADIALDKRLESLNGVYGQMREAQKTYASAERLDGLVTANNQRLDDLTRLVSERYEANRVRIETIEKGEVRTEGKELGRGATVAIIVTAVGLTGTVLAIIVALANLATRVGP